jgi:excisionase family DNA binding protein
MNNSNINTKTRVGSKVALAPNFASQPAEEPSTSRATPAAQALGYERRLNTKEVAAYLGLHPTTVARMARDGTIPAHPISGAPQDMGKIS